MNSVLSVSPSQKLFPLQLYHGAYFQALTLHATPPVFITMPRTPGLVSLADVQHGFSVTLLPQLHPEGASLHVYRTSTLTPSRVGREPRLSLKTGRGSEAQPSQQDSWI